MILESCIAKILAYSLVSVFSSEMGLYLAGSSFGLPGFGIVAMVAWRDSDGIEPVLAVKFGVA